MSSHRQCYFRFMLLLCLKTLIVNTHGLSKPKSSPTTDRGKNAKPILASVGATCQLKCRTKGSGNVQWYMDGKLIKHNQDKFSKFSFKRRHRKEILKISKIMIQDSGLYSCAVNERTTSWRVTVKNDKTRKCRTKRDTPAYTECPKGPRSRKMALPYCTEYLNFEKCSSLAGDPQDFKVAQFIYKNKPTVQAGWKMPRTGFNDLWGYDLELIGLRGALSQRKCVQINRKNRTFWSFIDVVYGAEYSIKLRSLPSNTFQRKTIRIREKCQFKEFKNKSAVCCLISDLNGTLVANEGKIHLSWRCQCPENTLSLKRFTIYWANLQLNNDQCVSSQNMSNQGPISETFNYTILLSEECRRYNYTIKVYGRDDSNRITEKGDGIILPFPVERPPLPSPNQTPTKRDDSDIKVTVAVIGSLLGAALIALLIVVYRFFISKAILRLPTNNGVDNPQGYDNDTTLLTSETPKRVLIIHARCCMKCDQVVHCLGEVLNETKAIETRIDFWKSHDIAQDPMGWYEKEVADADRVIILMSNKLKTLYDCADTPNVTNDLLPIKAQLNIVKGELREDPSNRKFISAFFTYNGKQTDVPSFLKSRLAHKLLKDLDRLIFHLLNIEVIQPHRTQPIAILGGTPVFHSKKESLSSAVGEAKEYHVGRDQNNSITAVST